MTDSAADGVTEDVHVRPYARLLTMLGEQLIKNDRIALVELIKNSYDADATLVVVDFIGFGPELVSGDASSIAITDNGHGMSEKTIRQDWLNPATPGKLDQKRVSSKSPGGRVLQGEKGIGRFAMFKLGSRVRMITRTSDSANEYVVDVDLRFLDDADASNDQGSTGNGAGSGDQEPRRHLFIEEIPVRLTIRTPVYFTPENAPGGKDHGTRIEIDALRSTWSEALVKKAFEDLSRLQPLIPQVVDQTIPTYAEPSDTDESDFDVVFRQNGTDLSVRRDRDLELKRLFDERAVLRVSGHFSDEEEAFVLNVNEHLSVVPLADPLIQGLKTYNEKFGTSIEEPRRPFACGSFDFSFFIFDLTAQAPATYHLDRDERELVKDHRIYLYRDGVRVLPYGDADDDWLQLDVIRGTQAAGRVLSNDQIVGFVYITQAENPHLRDKTNREGLLEAGDALSDFIALLQIVILYLRRADYARYQAANQQRDEATARRGQAVTAGFEDLLSNDALPKNVISKLKVLQKNYRNERDYMNVRLERTEDLAGVGLSVESASHDIIATANQALGHARAADRHVHSWHPDDETLVRYTVAIVEGVAFVSSRLDDVQGLFISTRRGKRQLEPAQFVSRVYRMYSSTIRGAGIRLDLEHLGPPLRVRTTDAALLQVLVNLFDNAIYWLTSAKTAEPRIHVVADHAQASLFFADNGPGVRPDDEEYIFEPFFSGKGAAGKGLGLYIARQVSLRNGFSIELISDRGKKIESGANFELKFARG